MITAIHRKFIPIIFIRPFQQLLATIVLRQHVEYKNILKPVVVNVSNVGTHSELREVSKHGMRYLPKGSIFVIDITKILFFVVIGDVDIRPSIVVQITE